MTNVAIIQGLYNSFASGDVPAVLGAMAANISWTEAEGFPYGGTYVGPNDILANVFMKFATEWEGFAAVPDSFIDGDDMIVALGTYSGKYLKTGKTTNVPFAHVWTVKDGSIVKFVQYADTLKLAKDIGL